MSKLSIIVDQPGDPTSVDTWAIVDSGVVGNIVVGSLDFIQSIIADHDYAVDVTVGGQTVSVGYLYNAGGDSFSKPLPPLAVCKMTNLTNFNNALMLWSHSYYSFETQFRFFMLYYLANTGGLLGAPSKPNRVAYIQPLIDWAQSIISYASSYTTSVMSQSDPATALNMQWDFGNISTPPTITLIGAVAISN